MLTKKQIEEVRGHLERAQNPIFYYDNDTDGLCSFLLLRRFIGRGYGVAIRSYPDLNADYLRKAEQLKADYIFVLDKAVISPEFISGVDSMQIPMVWIDHHDMNLAEVVKGFGKTSNISVYNPFLNADKMKNQGATSYLAYEISGRAEDIWIAMMGCIADCFMPDFANEFQKRYPEFWSKGIKKAFDAYYGSEIGKIALALNFGLKDSISHVVQLQNFLISCKSPNDVFLELETNKAFGVKYREIKDKYLLLLKEAKESASGKVISLIYAGDLSISSNLAERLHYLYPEKRIIVAYKKGAITNVSLRGEGVKRILEKILKKLENAIGGGHEKAVGARIRTEDLERFVEMLEQEI